MVPPLSQPVLFPKCAQPTIQRYKLPIHIQIYAYHLPSQAVCIIRIAHGAVEWGRPTVYSWNLSSLINDQKNKNLNFTILINHWRKWSPAKKCRNQAKVLVPPSGFRQYRISLNMWIFPQTIRESWENVISQVSTLLVETIIAGLLTWENEKRTTLRDLILGGRGVVPQKNV